jgi:hypothetical protein
MGGARLGAAEPEFKMKRILALFILTVSASGADAACICRCVDGRMQPVCENSLDNPPICPPAICGMVPPSIQPIPSPTIPPIGTSECHPRQVQNPATGMYEWKTICR